MQSTAIVFTAVFGVLATCFSVAAKVGFIVMIGAIIMAVADIIDANTAWSVAYVWIGCAVGAILSFVSTAICAAVATD